MSHYKYTGWINGQCAYRCAKAMFARGMQKKGAHSAKTGILWPGTAALQLTPPITQKQHVPLGTYDNSRHHASMWQRAPRDTTTAHPSIMARSLFGSAPTSSSTSDPEGKQSTETSSA